MRGIYASLQPALYDVQNRVADVKGLIRGEFGQGLH
jgi:hypothetical protein